MTINGVNYRPTKHGRKRYLKRVGMADDTTIIRHAVLGLPGFKVIWIPELQPKSFRLVTILAT